jgi:uncharacterized lipoprotein YajG
MVKKHILAKITASVLAMAGAAILGGCATSPRNGDFLPPQALSSPQLKQLAAMIQVQLQISFKPAQTQIALPEDCESTKEQFCQALASQFRSAGYAVFTQNAQIQKSQDVIKMSYSLAQVDDEQKKMVWLDIGMGSNSLSASFTVQNGVLQQIGSWAWRQE